MCQSLLKCFPRFYRPRSNLILSSKHANVASHLRHLRSLELTMVSIRFAVPLRLRTWGVSSFHLIHLSRIRFSVSLLAGEDHSWTAELMISSSMCASALMSNLVDDIPTFTYGMPVQLMILGVTITLLTILLIHLLFTVRYHIPLSRLNYGLQVSLSSLCRPLTALADPFLFRYVPLLQTTAVVLTLVSTAASIQILTDSLIQTSKTFPYMLNYSMYCHKSIDLISN